MYRKFLIAARILIAAGLAVSALAEGQTVGKVIGPNGWMLNQMTKKLNLTSAQQTQIKGILQAERPKIQPLMQQLRQNQQAQDAAMNGNFDENQARTFANQQTEIMANLIVERQRIKSQIYAVLTPDQRAKAQQLQQERQQQRQQRMQNNSQTPTPANPSQ